MSLDQIVKEAEALPSQDRWALASYLLHQLDRDPAWQPEPEAYFDELDRRMEEYRQDPSVAAPWETVKARILARHAAP